MPIADVPDIVRRGSYRNLSQDREGTGVTEGSGASHPGHTDWSRITFAFGRGPTVGKGSPPREKCRIKTRPIPVTFRSRPKPLRLDWRPREATSGERRAKVDEWVAQVVQQQRRHVRDGRDVAAKASAVWIAKGDQACGADEKAAKWTIQDLARADVPTNPPSACCREGSPCC